MTPHYPIVSISWMDAMSYDKWDNHTHHIDCDGLPVTTVGFLLRKDKYAVVVAANLASNGDLGLSMCIPRGMVKKIKVLKR